MSKYFLPTARHANAGVPRAKARNDDSDGIRG